MFGVFFSLGREVRVCFEMFGMFGMVWKCLECLEMFGNGWNALRCLGRKVRVRARVEVQKGRRVEG